MSDYISREAAIERIKEEWAKLPLSETTGFAILMRVLTKLPAADVRPVVLCRDCKYAERTGMADGCVWCNENLLGRLDDDFCSRGARMEEQT